MSCIALKLVLLGPLLCAAQEGIPGDPREQVLELFRKIEKDLQEIDKLLLEAGGSKAAEKSAEAAKAMEELLQKTMEGQKRVARSIDEILRKLPPDGQGSGGSSSQKPPTDPQGQKDPKDAEREKTPLDPGQLQPSGQPKSPKKDDSVGKNRPANPPPRPPGDPAELSKEGGKWGELPPLYQELFRNQKTDDVPLRYRRWIEEYYRRSNQAKSP